MRSRFIPLVLALAGASAFALAVQSAWWSAGEVAIGPFGSRHCFGGECRETGLSWLIALGRTDGASVSDLWMRAGVGARAAGYISMFMLIVLGGGLAAKRIPRLVARASLVAILTAIVTGGYFALGFPGLGGANVSYGVFFFVAAIVLGVAAAVFTLRLPEPVRD